MRLAISLARTRAHARRYPPTSSNASVWGLELGAGG